MKKITLFILFLTSIFSGYAQENTLGLYTERTVTNSFARNALINDNSTINESFSDAGTDAGSNVIQITSSSDANTQVYLNYNPRLDMSTYNTYHISLKSSSVDATVLRIQDASDVQVDLDPTNYGFVNDGAWHSLTIPIADITTVSSTIDLSVIKNLFLIKTVPGASIDFANYIYFVDDVYLSTTSTIWLGTTSDWNTASNWSSANIPSAIANVTIPAGRPNNPIISANTGAVSNNLTIDSGASLNITAGGSLIPNGASSGNITYNVNVSDTNWHLVASPLVGATYNDTWIVDNDIATGSDFGTNRGISTYDNSSFTSPNAAGSAGHWRYSQSGDSGTFETGVGYALIKDTNPGVSSGNYSFTGIMPIALTPPISQGVNNWNLVGNSFPSYMDITAFIAANGTVSGTSQLSAAFQSIYVWNPTSGGTGAYVELTTGYIQPGQSFFVNASASATSLAISKAMQSNQNPATSVFHKSSTPSLKLSVSNGISTKTTQINYLENETNGLDPGFDIGMFNGVASDLSIYTNLVENNEDIAFARQALPASGMESTIIPIGLKAGAGIEITFSIEALNLPNGIQVYLEDRNVNTLTSLTDGNVKVVLSENINGIGNYFLQLSSKALSSDSNSLESITVYTTSSNKLRIIGLSNAKASVKIFNITGKQVLDTSFKANGVQDITLPRLSSGVYIVQIKSENNKLNKKIILE